MRLTEAQARTRIKLLAEAASEPLLADPQDIDILLDIAKRIDQYGIEPSLGREWYPNMAVVVGDYVYPRTLNKHYYKVTASDGTAGAVEPVWPVASGAAVVLDGVTYTESGSTVWERTWDVNGAVAAGWLIKAGRTANQYLFMSGGKMLSRQQVHRQCLTMYHKYAMKSPLKAARLSQIVSSLDLVPNNT